MAFICSSGGEQYKDLGANHHMWTTAEMWDPGVITAQTRTATFTWFGGFHGGVEILVLDGQGIILAKTDPLRFGVDGTWIGRSDRTDPWSYNCDPNIDWRARGAASLRVLHFWAPNWEQVLDQWIQVGQKVAPFLAFL